MTDTLGPARLAFTKDAKGEVAGINIKGGGPIMSTTATKLSP